MSDIQKKIKKVIAEDILKTPAYKVADAKGMLKLDAMESPYEIPKEIFEQINNKLQSCEINRYPNPSPENIKNKIKEIFGIKGKNLDILFGNGSDEIIQMLIMAQLGFSRSTMAFEPSFVMYKIVCNSLRLPFMPVELNKDFTCDIDKTISLINSHQAGLFFIAQPNNPTGNLFSIEDIERIIETMDKIDGLVVLDEAYFAFHSHNYLPLLDKYQNLLIMRTFSKTSLAGLRFGFLIGHTEWINQLNKLRLPYNINSLTQSYMEVMLENFEWMKQGYENIASYREDMLVELDKFEEFRVFDSKANFVLIKTKKESSFYFNKLKEKKILIKDFGITKGLENCLRITVGSKEENAILLNALKEIAR